MRFRNVWALFRKDLADGLCNYHIILIVVTPILLSLLFSNLYTDSKSKTMIPKIGVIGSESHPLLGRLASESFGVRMVFFTDLKELKRKLLENEIGFGVLLPGNVDGPLNNGKKPKLTLLYLEGVSEFVVERMKTALEIEIRKFCKIEEPPLPIELELVPVGVRITGDKAFANDFFPMLVLMAMGMVGFLAMPISFVEEKEKRTLDAIFLTPTTPNEIIVGKNLFGLLLIITTVGIMVLLNHRGQGDVFFFWLFVLLGAALSLLVGLLISLFAKSQAGVNAVGTTLFMIYQLVPNLSQTSELMKTISPIVPSTYIGRGLKKAMFMDLDQVNITQDLATTAVIVMLVYLAVFLCLRYRRNVF
ncbi:MAG: ABC transporter permease [Candidatus Riflebacteria bacterium]|nr:ABC transporter permease [Candidatus Riflebacteria bacterium]